MSRWLRFKGWLRCFVGIHDLVGHMDCGDGVNIAPYPARAVRPGPGAWRKCNWCGASWRAVYDGISPSWQRIR